MSNYGIVYLKLMFKNDIYILKIWLFFSYICLLPSVSTIINFKIKVVKSRETTLETRYSSCCKMPANNQVINTTRYSSTKVKKHQGSKVSPTTSWSIPLITTGLTTVIASRESPCFVYFCTIPSPHAGHINLLSI